VTVEDLQSFGGLSGENGVGPADLIEDAFEGIELGWSVDSPVLGMGEQLFGGDSAKVFDAVTRFHAHIYGPDVLF